MLRQFSAQALAAGLLAAFVGFASTFAVIIQGLTTVGATRAQAASGLMALSVGMGVLGILISLYRREPISIAWSTPGAALLATSAPPAGGFAAAAGAFLVTGVLIVLAGSWRPLGRLVAATPVSLANAMLAGVLLGLCLAPVRAIAEVPMVGVSVVIVWALVARLRRLLAVPAAVLTAIVLIAATAHAPVAISASLWPEPALVTPAFPAGAMIGIALPLFIVTMASQNIPGIAVLGAQGFHPPPGKLFTATGVFTLLAAPFGAHALNLAAVTAALCAGPEAHPDPARRYWAAVVCGVAYIVFGLLAGAVTALLGLAPPVLIEAVAGLALLGAFATAVLAAVQAPQQREAAVITFLVTASGLSFLGVSGAFWGLLAGGAMLALRRWRPD